MNAGSLPVRAHQDGDVTSGDGPDARFGVQPDRPAEQVHDVSGDVGCHGFALHADTRRLFRTQRPQSHPRITWDPDDSRVRMGTSDRMHRDPGITQLQPAEHRLDPLDHCGVAAPVRGQSGMVIGVPRGVEVAEHISPAEGVNGLFRVPDQYQRPVAVERVAQDAPLGRVGVLELINQHDLVVLPQPLPGIVVGEGVLQAQHQIVEGDQSAGAAATQDLIANRLCEGEPGRLDRRGLDRAGVQCCLWVTDCRAGQSLGLVVGDPRLACRGAAVFAHVEVVDHLVDQVGDALDEHFARVGVGDDPQARQRVHAELVGGSDSSCVEVGHGAGQAIGGRLSLLLGEAEQLLDDDVGLRCPGPQGIAGAGQRFPHPFPQLAGGASTERDDEHLVDGGDALGDVAGGQRGDGVRLARAGTGLQQGGPRGQRGERIEGQGSAHEVSRAAMIGAQTRRANMANLVSSSNQFSSAPGGSRSRTSIPASAPHRATISGASRSAP